MSYYSELLRSLGPVPLSALGSKPSDERELRARANEAARLTRLLDDSPSFSFVRLGDMDLALLLAAQEGTPSDMPIFGATFQVNGTQSAGCPGISPRLTDRLSSAFRHADYVDFHDRLWPMNELLPRLQFHRHPDLQRNPDAVTSYILLTWVEREFRGYCERHRVGFCGAEAAVLEALAKTGELQGTKAGVWPQNGAAFFHQPKDNGSNLDANLDEVKEDLKSFINTTQIDTLFLSLGGGAKILCHELARECSIRCVDFGAMLRALCYLGSDGNRAGRSTHSPFYRRLPFDLVMDAVESAYPDLPPEVLLAKAHAQAILELQHKQVGWTSASAELEFNEDNLEAFRRANQACRRRYRRLRHLNPATRLEHKCFLHFCGKHALTLEGRAYHAWFRGKSALAAMVRPGFRQHASL